jgi:hypothetical protein
MSLNALLISISNLLAIMKRNASKKYANRSSLHDAPLELLEVLVDEGLQELPHLPGVVFNGSCLQGWRRDILN